MGQGIQSGLTSVTGTVTSTETIRTVSWLSAEQSGAGSATIGTVGAGKKWRILSVQLGGGAPAASTSAGIQLNGVYALRHYHNNQAATTMSLSNSITWAYSAAPQLAAGQTAVLVGAASTTVEGQISYVEETA
jgi:hypothetical protein